MSVGTVMALSMDLKTLRVLLVEDNELDARTMLKALREAAETTFELERATTCADALALLENAAFDCILLDLTLPDSSGLTSLDLIIEAAPQSPVVLLTGLDDPMVAVEAVERGAHDFLPKNKVDGKLVARAIRYAVTRHSSEVGLRSANEQLRVAHERERIAQDLHDTVVQELFATGMSIQAISGRIDDEGLRTTLLESVDNIDGAIRRLRQTIFDLTSVQPEPVGDVFDDVIRSERGALGFDPAVTRKGQAVISQRLQREAAAVVQEALSNVAKHAQASEVDVLIDVTEGRLKIEVTDNGLGMDGAKSLTNPLSGHGTENMAVRAQSLGGTCEVISSAGDGTTVCWSAPLTS